MEDFEFKKQYQMIEDQKDVAKTYKNKFNNTLPVLNNLIQTVTGNIEKRNELLKRYTDAVHDFNYDSSLTKPSDIFVGVRTAADMADPEELRNKTEKMKSDAAEIERLENAIESNQDSLITSFKDVYAAIVEYLIQSNSIYEMSVDLLNKLDSIYDVAQIARNS